VSHVWKLPVVPVVGISKVLADEAVKRGPSVSFLVVATISKGGSDQGPEPREYFTNG